MSRLEKEEGDFISVIFIMRDRPDYKRFLKMQDEFGIDKTRKSFTKYIKKRY